MEVLFRSISISCVIDYTNVMEVDGGMNAWQATGNKLMSKQ